MIAIIGNKSLAAIVITIVAIFNFSCISAQNDCFIVSTESMEPNFTKGDKVCFTPFVNPKNGEIGLFDLNETSEKWFFRIVAQSGDTLIMKDGLLFLNAQRVEEDYNFKDDFRIKTNVVLDDAFLSKHQITRIGNNEYSFIGEKKNLESFLEKSAVKTDSILSNNTSKGGVIKVTDLDSKDIVQNASNFSIVIPKVGDKIIITDKNFDLFKQILNVNELKSSFINKSFEVREKLYFLLGDNRIGSFDSRYIGLIPEHKFRGIIKN